MMRYKASIKYNHCFVALIASSLNVKRVFIVPQCSLTSLFQREIISRKWD